MKLRKLKLNYSDGMRQAGTILTIRCDSNGIPLESKWRRRLKDAEQDNCVEFVDEKKVQAQNTESKDQQSKDQPIESKKQSGKSKGKGDK